VNTGEVKEPTREYVVILKQFTFIDYDIVVRRLQRFLEGQFKILSYSGRKEPYYVTLTTTEGEWFKTHPLPGVVIIEQQCSHCMTERKEQASHEI